MAADGVRINLNQIQAALRDTDKKFAAASRKRVRATLTEAGAGMVSAIRERASWSSRIPGAVRLQTTFSVRNSKVKVVVDHNKAPHARPLELGNRNGFDEGEIAKRTVTIAGIQAGRRRAMAAMKREGVGVSRLLRHPVWDSRHPAGRWSAMPTRPFFFPAASETAEVTEALMDQAMTQIANDAGFH